MRIKQILTIFIVGLLLGIGLSPLAEVQPQKAFLSPVTVTLAEEGRSSLSSDSGKILGAETQDSKMEWQEARQKLLAQQDDDLGRNSPLVKSETKEKDNSSNSSIIQNVSSKEVTIAIYGDSMVDTMGTALPYLETALEQYYPQVNFALLNYGIGAKSIEQGKEGFNQAYSYKDRNYPAPTSSGADIIIIESFAYNPMGEDGLDKQWLALSQIVDQARASGAKVMLLAIIAPTKSQFGQGPGGIDWPQDTAWQHAGLIGRYLENAVSLGGSLNLPVIDAYHASLLANGEGNLNYISSHDHIHPSVAGHQFVANLVVQKIVQLNLIP